MKQNPYDVVKMFEQSVADYTGAPYAVSLDSCTNALFLCCMYENVKGKEVRIPKQTLCTLGVRMSLKTCAGKASIS